MRELRNEVARHAALGDLAEIDRRARDDGSERNPLDAIIALDLPFSRAKERVIAEFERRYVDAVVAKHGGNVSHAAASSGLALRYFQLLRARHSK